MILIWIICSVLICLGAFLLAEAFKSYRKVQNLYEKGDRATATIIEVEKQIEENYDPEGGLRSISYWPTYEFTDCYGQIRYCRPSSTSGLEKYKVGDVVTIAYDPDAENDVIVLTSGRNKDVWGFAVSGVLCVGIGVLILWNKTMT